jgi:diguanylate cyclase (GGDEF)-like protein
VYAGLLLLGPVLMRRTGSTEIAAHWLLANGFVILSYEAVLLGGVDSTAFAWLQEKEINALIEHLGDERARFRHAATRDPLTGLLNRSLLAEHLSRMLARTQRNGSRGALSYGDLDGFKSVNDEWGHYVGDLLLKGVAERLCAETRGCDIVLRVGGDEFVLLVEELADRKTAAFVAEKVVARVQRPFDVDGQPVSVGLSLGIVMIEGQLARPGQLLDAADSAMYAAKRGGRAYHFA